MPSKRLPGEEAMKRIRSTIAALTVLAAAATSQPLAAQSSDFYAGKTLKIIVGLEAGGTVDTLARLFIGHLRRHIPGNPTIVIQNMPSAAGVGATNFEGPN
jgi:tripartite-type tricarboxylate transporter receptor subunit TctC